MNLTSTVTCDIRIKLEEPSGTNANVVICTPGRANQQEDRHT